ncbi:MAG: MopE-related protein [Candidatus Nanoarchaeia archaeon]|nr:MopE-related protein [Candidatus Nanoarchaeia archaeon]
MRFDKSIIFITLLILFSFSVSAEIGTSPDNCKGKDLTDHIFNDNLITNGWNNLYQQMQVNDVHTISFKGISNDNPDPITVTYSLFYCKRACDLNGDGKVTAADACSDHLVLQQKTVIEANSKKDITINFKPAQEGCYQLDWAVEKIENSQCSYLDKTYCEDCTFLAYLVDTSCKAGSTQTRKCGYSDVGECSYGTKTLTCTAQSQLIGPTSYWKYGICIGATYPTTEICDQKDNDCDGLIDEDNVCEVPECEDGETQTQQCGITDVGICEYGHKEKICENGSWGNWGDCIGAINPSTEICNQLDDDCDGLIDEGDVCPPEECYTNDDCDNGLYCDGEEICIDNECYSGTEINCNLYNIPGINTCYNSPDSNPYTLDYRNAFTSTCNEDLDMCTIGSSIISHICYYGCGAECIDSCEKTECDYLDGCYGNDYYDYSDVSNLCNSCLCSHNECGLPVISENDPRCEQPECTEGDIDIVSCGMTDVGECSYGQKQRICIDEEWTDWSECVGSVNPTTEICDQKDNDCDGLIDEDKVCEICVLNKTRLDGENGFIDHINEFTNEDFTKNKIDFKAWVSKSDKYTGYVIVSVTGTTTDGGRLSLKLKGKVRNVYENTCEAFNVENSWWSLATYRAPNSKKTEKIHLDSIWYEWNRETNLLNVYGIGPDIDFEINNIEIESKY